MANIPNKIKIVSSKKKAKEIQFISEGKKIELDVIPAFIVDAYNTKTLNTAIQWAGGENECNIVELDNTPIKNVTITGLDYRGNGGRAYKVIFTIPNIIENAYVDLREDTLVETMFSVGINAGAVLNGEYIWSCDNGSRLLRIDSEKYNNLIKNNKQLEKPSETIQKITEPGTLYKTKNGSVRIYFGYGRSYYNQCNAQIIEYAHITVNYNKNSHLEMKNEAFTKEIIFTSKLINETNFLDGEIKSISNTKKFHEGTILKILNKSEIKQIFEKINSFQEKNIIQTLSDTKKFDYYNQSLLMFPSAYPLFNDEGFKQFNIYTALSDREIIRLSSNLIKALKEINIKKAKRIKYNPANPSQPIETIIPFEEK